MLGPPLSALDTLHYSKRHADHEGEPVHEYFVDTLEPGNIPEPPTLFTLPRSLVPLKR